MNSHKILLFIGSDNETHTINTDYLNRCLGVISSFFDGFIISFSDGYYKGVKEDSLTITIYTENLKDVDRCINELKRELKQESILKEITKTEYAFI